MSVLFFLTMSFFLKISIFKFCTYECFISFFVNLKASYYWLNRQELLQKNKRQIS